MASDIVSEGLGGRNARAVVCLRACTFLLIISTTRYAVSNPYTRASGVCFAPEPLFLT